MLLRGDGIGPEIVDAALRVVRETGVDLQFHEYGFGWEQFKKSGTMMDPDIIDVGEYVA